MKTQCKIFLGFSTSFSDKSCESVPLLSENTVCNFPKQKGSKIVHCVFTYEWHILNGFVCIRIRNAQEKFTLCFHLRVAQIEWICLYKNWKFFGKMYTVFSLKSGTDSHDLLKTKLEKLRIRKIVPCVFT